MDLVSIVKSIEEFFYQFMFWLMMLPKAFFQPLAKPKRIYQAISEEMDKEPAEQFKGSVTPFILWFFSSLLLTASLDTFSAEGVSMITGQSALLMIAVILALPPIVFTYLMLKANHISPSYESFRFPFFIQLTIFGVFQLLSAIFLLMTQYTIDNTPSNTFYLVYILYLVFFPIWLLRAEISVMNGYLQSSWFKSVAWTIAGIVILAIGTWILIPVFGPLFNTILSAFPS